MPGEDDETIIVRAILRDELSDSAEGINRNLDDLQENLDETADSTDNLTDAERRNQEQSEKTARQIQAENQQRDAHGRFIREETQATEENTQVQKRNTRVRSQSTKATAKQAKVFGKLNGMFTQFVKAGAMLDAVSQAAQGIGALGTAAIAAGNGIGLMSGSLLAVPSMLGGVAQAAIVGKLAFSGMGDAISALASGDYEKFADATKDMAPNMINASKAMGVLGQKWKPIVKDIQDKVWKDLGDQITSVGDKVLPLIQKSFMTTAGSINTAMKEVLRFTGSANGMRQIGTILDTNAVIAGQFTRTLTAGFKGLVGVMSAASPAAIRLGGALEGALSGLANKAQANQTAIANFANKGVDVLLRFARVVRDFAVGLVNMGKAAMGVTSWMGKGFEDVAAKFRAWTGSVEGQNKMKEYFDGMKPTLSALWNLIKVLGQSFMDLSKNTNLADLINQLADAVPTFQALVEQSSGKFLPALLDVVKSLGDVVVQMNALGATSTILNAVAAVVKVIGDAFNALPGPVQTVIGQIVAYGLVVKSVTASSVGQWLLQRQAVQAWGNYFKLVLRSQMANLRAYVATQRAAFAQSAVGMKLAAAWGAITRGIKAAALAVRTFSASLLSFLFTNPIGWIILAVIALVAVFIILWKKCEGFRNLVKAIGQWFVNVWNNVLFPVIMKVWDWMKSVWDRVYGFIKGVVMGIVNFFRSHWDTIKTIALVVWTVIKTYFMILWKVISTYVKVWITIFKFAFNIIKTIVVTAFNVISAVVRVFAPIVIAVFKVIWQVIRIIFYSIRLVVFVVIQAIILYVKMVLAVWTFVWNIAKTVVLAIWNALLAYWRFMWNIIKAVFMVVWNAILAVIRFLTPIVQAVINFVVMIFTTGWNFVKTVVSIAINIIMGIIRTIIGVAQSVIGFVIGIFQSGWNAVSGVVSGVIGTIRGVIDTISGVVSRVVDSIRNGFTTAFNAVRDFVMPILDTIKGTIDRIGDAARSIGDKIKSIGDTLNPFNFAGGPVSAGLTSYVGELGPEAFVTHTGKVEMIGQKGMELRQFNQPGYIVPNHVLRGYSDSSVPNAVMSKLGKAMTPGEPTLGTYETRGARENLSRDTYMQDQKGGGDHYDFRGAHFGGSPAETKKAVLAAIRESERNKKERG